MKIFYLIYYAQIVCVTNVFGVYDFDKTNNKIDSAKKTDAEHFYAAVKRFYFNSESSVQVVYGPVEDSLIDLEKSRGYINQLFWKDGKAIRGTKRALDCGAGNGRVTYNVLMKYFDKIDLVEQDEHFANAALDLIGKDNYEKLGIMYKVGVQDFYPEKRYDLIWIQGVLEYMTDTDVISLLSRLRSALQPNGVIVIKENVSDMDETILRPEDDYDPCIVRTADQFLEILEKVKLKVVRRDVEHGANNLHEPPWIPVLVLAVIPRTDGDEFTEFLKKYKGFVVTLFFLNLFIFYFFISGLIKYLKR